MGKPEAEQHGVEALARLQAVTSQEQARAVYGTWLAIQQHGLQGAKAFVGTRSYFRHLDLLRRAGLLSPGRSEAAPEGWYAVLESVGALLGLPGRRFRVCRRSQQMECFPVGTRGTVDAVLFRGNRWSVGVDFDGIPGGYEEIDLREFARATEPLPGRPSSVRQRTKSQEVGTA